MPTSRRASRKGLITIGASRPRFHRREMWGRWRSLIEISSFAPVIAAGIGVARDRMRKCRIPNLLRAGPSIIEVVVDVRDAGRRPCGGERLIVFGPGAHAPDEGHDSVVGVDRDVVGVDLGV